MTSRRWPSNSDSFDYADKTVPVIGAEGEITGSESYIDSRGGAQSTVPRYACDRNGAFEVYLPSESTNYVLRQQLDQPSMGLGGAWNAGNPVTGIGDNRWLNYKASVDVSFENSSTQSGNNYAAIGARQQGGDTSHDIAGTPYVLKYLLDGSWQLLVDGKAASSGNVVSGTGGVTIAGFNSAQGGRRYAERERRRRGGRSHPIAGLCTELVPATACRSSWGKVPRLFVPAERSSVGDATPVRGDPFAHCQATVGCLRAGIRR